MGVPVFFSLFGMLTFPLSVLAEGVGAVVKEVVKETVKDEIRYQVNENVITPAEKQAREAIERQIEEAERQISNPLQKSWEKCMQAYTGCSQRVQAALCGSSQIAVSEVKQTDTKQDRYQDQAATYKCMDGSEPNYEAMSKASNSCEIPSNCQAVMEQYMSFMMARGIAEGYLTPMLPSIPAMPNVPRIPYKTKYYREIKSQRGNE